MSRHGKKTRYSERAHHSTFDMESAVRRVLVDAGFEPELDAAARDQLATIKPLAPIAAAGRSARWKC